MRPSFVKTLEQVERDNPDLVAFMKRHAVKRFEDCGVVIGSFPEGYPGPCVYGYFVVDRCEAAKPNPAQALKQDFVVDDPKTGTAVYYRGLIKAEVNPKGVQSIKAFCVRFGAGGGYGCAEVSPGKWTCSNHHYAGENDGKLPHEPEVRSAIAATFARIRQGLPSTRSAGSASPTS